MRTTIWRVVLILLMQTIYPVAVVLGNSPSITIGRLPLLTLKLPQSTILTVPCCILSIVTALFFVASIARGNDPLTFERHVHPILKAHCFDCHGATSEPEGGLDLRLRRFIVRGGDSGTAIQPGKPAESYLLERIQTGEMPPGDKKVTAEEYLLLKQWIAAGAITAREEPKELDEGIVITAEEREFWSFQPLVRPNVPELTDSNGVRTPIDAFILAKLQQVGLGFSPEADDRTLLYRATIDLTGLPPTPAEVTDYLSNESPDKYKMLIDQLLASPRYGERWARHWLDVAGYADTEGYTPSDADRPWAYRYRDYVIKSLNADKPFDQFVLEQLAGDELVMPPYKNLNQQQIEYLTATGFLRMAVDGTGSGANDDKARNHTIADTIKIVTTSLLGLSAGCAQCHDHRYDPIPHTDYYQLRAIFEPALDWKNWRTPGQRLISLYTDAERTAANEVEEKVKKVAAEKNIQLKRYIQEELEKELLKHEKGQRQKLRAAYETPADQRTDEQKLLLKENPSINITGGTLYQYNQASADELKKFDKKITEIRKQKPAQKFIRALTEKSGQVPVTHLFYRGEYRQPKQAVTPAAFSICAPTGNRFEIPVNSEHLPSTGRRLAFARWLFRGTHPLVGRVLVNRFWMHHFGRAIVGTPSDFGVLGQKPSHPKLLNWLAVEFANNGWSLKSLHRQIMLSTVYRQSSKSDPARSAIDGAAIDGANLLYWKKPLIRLRAEALYDRILATSGVLEQQLYGPSVAITTDTAGQIVVAGESKRRSIYVKVKRTQPVALLKSFDAPVMEVNCGRRPSSTVATQALMLMNSQYILKHAKSFAQRVARESGNVEALPMEDELPQFDDIADAEPQQVPFPQQIVLAWQLAYGRQPTADEYLAALNLLSEQISILAANSNKAKDIAPGLQAMTNLCQVLMSSNEFLYID
jgi:hypothetical protein